MINNKKLQAMNYLKNEFQKLQNDNPIATLGCTVGLIDNNLFKWRVSIIGPSDTPYAGGMFFLTAEFPEDYPIGKPKVNFQTKIYHVNISPMDGQICVSTLKYWKPNTPFSSVIISIFALFYNQNANDPFSPQLAQVYKSNYPQYVQNAREWTKKYASMD